MSQDNQILNFIGIGAQKAGTTSLHSVLRTHPEVFVPVVEKEPHFFDEKYLVGYPDYIQEYFAELGDEKAVGEITPSLLCVRDARDRIRETLGPDIKFIVMLRHPITRALSHYKMNLSWLWELESFESAIKNEDKRVKAGVPMRFNYFGRGRYLEQIKHYLEVFDRSQFHFILFEELIENHQETLSACFEFLGVSNMQVPNFPHANTQKKVQLIRFDQPTGVKVNQGGNESELVMPVGSWLISSDFKGRARLVKSPTSLLRKRLETIKELFEQVLPGEARISDLYNTHFQADESELSDLTGLDLSRWRVSGVG